jgi:hypothetical protein
MTNAAIISMNNSDIIKANIINNRVGDAFVTGYLLSLGNELRKRMQKEVVEFYFTKKDGTLRRAFGTTMSSLAQKHTVGGHHSSIKVITFFDVEKSEWRSCQINSLLKVL